MNPAIIVKSNDVDRDDFLETIMICDSDTNSGHIRSGTSSLKASKNKATIEADKPSCSYRKDCVEFMEDDETESESQVFIESVFLDLSNESESKNPKSDNAVKTEFDKELEKINEMNPAMTNYDRIVNWNVTKEDLLQSMPVLGNLHDLPPKKRSIDVIIPVPGSDSDSYGSPSLPKASHSSLKKFKSSARRDDDSDDDVMFIGFEEDKESISSNDLDFCSNPLNPEIDKIPKTKKASMIEIRKDYHKIRRKYDYFIDDDESFKRPTTPSKRNDVVSPCKEEFYKYLGINTTPVYERSATRERKKQHRRSLRVRVQHLMHNNSNKISSTSDDDKLSDDNSQDSSIISINSDSDIPKSGILISKSYSVMNNHAETVKSAENNYCKIIKHADGNENIIPMSPPDARTLNMTCSAVSKYDKDHKKPNLLNKIKTKYSSKKFKFKTAKNKLNKRRLSGYLFRSNIVLNNSLRNGKIRKKNSLIKFLKKTHKLKPRSKEVPIDETILAKAVVVLSDCESRLHAETPVPVIKSINNLLTINSRVSIDSAVSSTTSPDLINNNSQPALSQIKSIWNPLNKSFGDVMKAYFINNILIVVQASLISFWKYSKLPTLLGIQQKWEFIGKSKRSIIDEELQRDNPNRICYNASEPVYLDFRAKQIPSFDDTRPCPLASVYTNLYYVDHQKDDYPDTYVKTKSLQLDSIYGYATTVCYTIIPNTRYFILSWQEQISPQENRTGLCKYSLTPDLETLASIREFPFIDHRIYSLKCFDGNKLIGLGSTELSIWDYANGDLLYSVDLKMDLKLNLTSFTHTEEDEYFLFLVQMCDSSSFDRKTVKIISIDLNSWSWRVIHSHNIRFISNKISGQSLTTSNLHTTTFENGEILCVSLNNLQTIYTNPYKILDEKMQSEGKVKLFAASDGEHLILVSENSLNVKTLTEYLIEFR